MPGPQLTPEQRHLKSTIESRVWDMTIGAGSCKSSEPTESQLKKLWKALEIDAPGDLEVKWAKAHWRECYQCFHQP